MRIVFAVPAAEHALRSIPATGSTGDIDEDLGHQKSASLRNAFSVHDTPALCKYGQGKWGPWQRPQNSGTHRSGKCNRLNETKVPALRKMNIDPQANYRRPRKHLQTEFPNQYVRTAHHRRTGIEGTSDTVGESNRLRMIDPRQHRRIRCLGSADWSWNQISNWPAESLAERSVDPLMVWGQA